MTYTYYKMLILAQVGLIHTANICKKTKQNKKVKKKSQYFFAGWEHRVKPQGLKTSALPKAVYKKY